MTTIIDNKEVYTWNEVSNILCISGTMLKRIALHWNPFVFDTIEYDKSSYILKTPRNEGIIDAILHISAHHHRNGIRQGLDLSTALQEVKDRHTTKVDEEF